MEHLIAKTENKNEVAYLKERLLTYTYNEREIDDQIERLERLKLKLYGTSSKELTDMPRAPSASLDRIADLEARKDELEQKIRDMINSQQAERDWIESKVCKLKNPDQRAVIRMRYLDSEKWVDVCELLFGGKEDFVGKEDSYLRRVMILHGKALLNIVKKSKAG